MENSPIDVNDYRPSCPVIFYLKNKQHGTEIDNLHCQSLKVNVECYISTAIVSMDGLWTNQTKDTLDCIFALPTPGTIMNIQLRIGPERLITNAYLSKEDAVELLKNKGKIHEEDITPESASPYEQYIQDLFRLPCNKIEPGASIRLLCQYLEPLQYYKIGYVLEVPLSFPPGTRPPDIDISKLVSVECKINALSEFISVECDSHKIETTKKDDTLIIKALEAKPLPENSDMDVDVVKDGRNFEISYNVQTKEPLALCIKQHNNNINTIDEKNDEKLENSLCLFVTPPNSAETTFGRAFFFILDRSGSMEGEPFIEATKALTRAIDRLREEDAFNVCMFDHQQVYFVNSLPPDTKRAGDAELVFATETNKNNAKNWIQSYEPNRGGTIIDAPIAYALNVLESCSLLPFVVLITDGAVANEKDICRDIQQNKHLRTRFLTLGIGSFCNWFFLKMVSQIGRGFSDVVVFREHIFHKIDHLLRMAGTPILTDIEINLDASDLQIYPYPVPDLFGGAPIVVSGRYKYSEDSDPTEIVVNGFDPHDKKTTIKCPIQTRDDLPVDKIFVKQQIDLLTAETWFRNSDDLKQQVIDISIEHSLPSQYTAFVSFETTQKQYDNEENKWKSNNQNSNSGKTFLSKIKNNKKTVAALATTGTLAIVAVSAATFGNVQQTLDNIPLFGGGDHGLNITTMDHCCDCGGCGNCGHCCHGCGCTDCGNCDIM